MSTRTSRSKLAGRRAELLAEVFFQELDPAFLSRPPTPDVGYDLLVGFRNERSGINTFAIEVVSTEEPVGDRISIGRATFDRLAHSNVPGILLVADVKRNRLYYAWLQSDGPDARGRNATILIPVREVTDATKSELRKLLRRANGAIAAVS